jgi:hypothetical protein
VSAHTVKPAPGPWAIAEVEDSDAIKLVDADGEFLSFISKSRYVDGRPDPIAAANARLIAAAPMMLDALEVIANSATVGGISSGERKGLARAAAIARTALAKAGA